jgi:hypothetical protein
MSGTTNAEQQMQVPFYPMLHLQQHLQLNHHLGPWQHHSLHLQPPQILKHKQIFQQQLQ